MGFMKEGTLYCTVPYFGFKAKLTPLAPLLKLIVLCLILDSRQNPLYK